MNHETLRVKTCNRILSGALRLRSAPNINPGFFTQGFRQLVGSNGSTLVDPYEQSEWVYAGIHAIAKAISAVPLKAVVGDEKSPKQVGGPWQEFFDAPCDGLTRAQFWQATTIYLYTRSGCKWLLVGKTGPLKPNEIPAKAWPLPGNVVEPVDSSGRAIRDINQKPDGWRVNVSMDGRTISKIYGAHEIVDLKFFNPSNPVYGFLPLNPLMNAANFGFAAMTWGAAYFVNNVDPGGWIENGPETETQVKALKAGIYDEHGGPLKRGKLMILPKNAKFVQNDRSQKEMEFIEGQRWSREAVLAVLGVPAAILGITQDVTYANFEGAMKIFYKNTIVPVLGDMSDALYSQAMKRIGEEWPQFDLSSIEWLSMDRGAKIGQLGQLAMLGYGIDQANEYLGLGLPKAPSVIADDDPLLKALGEPAATAATGASTAAVQDTAFNGAQVASLVDVVSKVSEKIMPAEAAKQIILAGFPTVSEEQASAMVESAAAFDAPTEEPRFHAPYVKRGKAVISDRIGYVAEYIRAVVIPSEKKLNAAMRRYLAALGLDQRKRLADWLKKNGLTGDSLATFTKEDVDAILFQRERWDKALRASGSPAIEATIKGALKATADEVGGAFLPMSNPRVSDLFGETIGILVKEVNDTTRERIRGHLLASTAQGETIQQAQMRLAPWVNENPARALLIARTETGMASSGARYVGLQEAEIEKHEWVTAGSGDIRETHEKAGGEVVEIGEKFSNGLLHPHEIGADPSEVCNCRCEALAV